MGEAYVVVLRLGGGLHGEYSSKEVQSLLALVAMVPVSGCCQGSCYSARWENIVTPFHLKQCEIGLVGHVDRDFVVYLCDGIRDGFRIGFGYCTKVCRSVAGNMKSVKEHRDVVQVDIDGERQAGRVLGPFDRDQFLWCKLALLVSFLRVSRVSGGLFWICHLQRGLVRMMVLIKTWVLCPTCQWMRWWRVVEEGRGALLAKFDLKAAYRNVPVHPEELSMVWGDELYVDSVCLLG